MPFYVAPEQFMKDKADFARKNIARGRPLIAAAYADGILICAENTSKTLHKVSEIYDRIAFAGVGPGTTSSNTNCVARGCSTPTSRATSSAGRTSA